jgi:hypothetical protein
MADSSQLTYNNNKFGDILKGFGFTPEKQEELFNQFTQYQAYVDVTQGSANLNIALSAQGSTLLLNSVYTVVNSNSGYWNQSIASLLGGSVLWNNVYTTVKANSAAWGTGGGGNNSTDTVVQANSASWISTTNTVNTNNIIWSSVYSNVNSLSSRWQSAYSTVNANSGTWGTGGSFDGSVVVSSSANWNRAYVMANILGGLSANDQSVYSNTNANSANWNRAYNISNVLAESSAANAAVVANVNANSPNWNTAYNQSNILAETSANNASNYSTVNANSATWGAGGDDVVVSTLVRATSAQWNLAKAETNILGELSANNKSVYSTVNSNSATWGTGGGDDIPVTNLVRATSANWNSVYSTVNSNS